MLRSAKARASVAVLSFRRRLSAAVATRRLDSNTAASRGKFGSVTLTPQAPQPKEWTSLAVTPEGSLLAATDGAVLCFDLANRQPLAVSDERGPSSMLSGVRYSRWRITCGVSDLRYATRATRQSARPSTRSSLPLTAGAQTSPGGGSTSGKRALY